MGWLLSLYIAATVFGVGVTALDLIGLIGDQDSEGDDGDGGYETDGEASDGGDSSAGDAGEGSEVAEGGDGGSHPSITGHDRHHHRNPVLRILSALRNMVYFALGFGPTGWFALGTGESVAASLIWGGAVGVVVVAGARILRRILRSELSSEIQQSDLLMETGTVLITVDPNKLGRVRVRIGEAFVDRYARSRSDTPIAPGTAIRVIDIGEDCIYIETEEG